MSQIYYYPNYDGGIPVPVQPCAIEEFFKNEAKKPPNMRSSACMISCQCPRCRVNM